MTSFRQLGCEPLYKTLPKVTGPNRYREGGDDALERDGIGVIGTLPLSRVDPGSRKGLGSNYLLNP